MKKLLAAFLAAALCLSAFAQEEEKEMKTGWSFGVLPTATYSVDNGYQAGAFGDVYYYGDGSTYPDPLHKFSWEASYFTHSHRMRYYLAYDSKYLVPGMRINASATYVTDPLYSFWGFNGPASIQNYDVWGQRGYALPGGLGNKDINYYGMSRNMLRLLANVQGRITDNLNWAAGLNFWNWTLGSMKDNGVKDDNAPPITADFFYARQGRAAHGAQHPATEMVAGELGHLFAVANVNGNVTATRNYLSRLPCDMFLLGE